MVALIFSKNRAMQLDALLRSMEENFDYCVVVFVLYTATNKEHQDGYDKLISDKRAVFIKQTDFKKNTEDIIREFGHVCILCDDDIYYKRVKNKPKIKHHETYSVRLGSNVANKRYFDYTISLDGNVFLAYDLLPLLEKEQYNNPNDLEKVLVKSQNQFKQIYDEQCLIGIPHNRVSTGSGCSFSGGYTEDSLAINFNVGFRIDYKAMDFSNIDNVHKDIDYKFYNINND